MKRVVNSSVLMVLLILVIAHVGRTQCPIIPAPEVWRPNTGTFTFDKAVYVNEKNLPDNIRDLLIERFNRQMDLRLIFSNSGKHMEFSRLVNVPEDFYSITITETIRIQYSSERSCFYAMQSLFQLLKQEDGAWQLDRCFIQDSPKYQWRGLHLDVSRHFFTVEEVKRYIDLMALYKFNTFHWHLTDDQGWRIEIKKYPKLTEIGAWRDSTLNGHYSATPRTYTKERYGGFYTQEQIRDVVAYASKRYIEVVPEIEMPGHSRAALAAYPQFSCTGEQQGVPGIWGVFDDIFCTHASTIDFLKDILDEVIVLFPSKYIHVGGDEAPKSRWQKCRKCQAVIRENGLKDEHELQSWFIRQIDDFLTSRGRKLIGWDEILEGGLSPNATVMSWRGMEGGIEAARMGHNVVMSPGSHCYFDHYQSTNPNEPVAIGGYTPLEKVYDFDPLPQGLNTSEGAYILGGQANLWTEYIPDMKQLEYMTYPRALALAQVLWCRSKPAFDEFKKVFVTFQIPYLEKYQVNFSRAFFYPEMEIVGHLNGLNVHFRSGEPNYHFDLFVKSDEQAPAMNGGQIVGEKDSIYFERTTGSKVVNYRFRVSSETLKTPATFDLKVHPAIGLPIELITPPNQRYAGKGGFTLVDGVKGARPWRGNQWLGFDTNRIEFYIDLGKKSEISSVNLGFLQDEGSWILLPDKVEMYVSANKHKWKQVKENSAAGTVKEDYVRSINRKGRYLKVVVSSVDKIPAGKPGEGNRPWTFIDELIVFFN